MEKPLRLLGKVWIKRLDCRMKARSKRWDCWRKRGETVGIAAESVGIAGEGMEKDLG